MRSLEKVYSSRLLDINLTFMKSFETHKNCFILCRRGTSGHPPLKKPLTGKASFLPKLEQHSNITHIPVQSVRAMAAAESISLPKINSSSNSNITLSQNQSDSHIRLNSTKRLMTIQIPSASGDSLPQSSTREKQPKAANHHSSVNSRIRLTASSSSSKSRNRSLTEQLSDRSLLAPVCSSYGGLVVGQPRQRSDEQLTEGSPRKLSETDSTGIHGAKSEDGERDEGLLAVVPAIGNLSASRFSELKQTNGMSSVNSLPPSIGGLKKPRRGSLVMGDKPMKRCVSLRVSLKNPQQITI